MSYIVTMLTQGYIVMAADRQICHFPVKEKIAGRAPTPENMIYLNEFLTNNVQRICDDIYEKYQNHYNVLTKSAKKLFTVNDNIAFSTGQKLYTRELCPVELLADQFCRKNTFEKPADTAKSLFDFMCSKDAAMDLTIHLAGYDKNKELFTPEFYEINILQKTCERWGSTGLVFAGANDYFSPFVDKIANQIKLYTVQDAVDICCFAIDMSRKLQKYVDFQEVISEDYDVLAITANGLQWVKKAKLEARQ